MRRVSSPNWEASGHPTGSLVPRLIWAAVQASRPWAADGEIVIPSGRVTTAFFSGGVAMPLTKPLAA